MPPNTVRVTRPGPFGNPFLVEEMGAHEAVAAFRRFVTGPLWEDPDVRAQQEALRAAIPSLRGWNLACWCKLGPFNWPCHADVLLEVANEALSGDPLVTTIPTKSTV